MVERIVPGTQEWSDMHADHLARYLFAVDFVKQRSVLDAGTGVGYGAAVLKAYQAAAVHAVDLDPQAIATAEKLFGHLGVSYLVDDCEDLGRVHGPFDVVCSFENLEHLQEPSRFLARAADLLAPDGVLLCSTPDRAHTRPFINGKPANPYHVHEWYEDEFMSLLSHHFGDVTLMTQVQHNASRERQCALRSLVNYLEQVQRGTLFGLKQLVKRAVGRRVYRPDLEALARPTVADFPIMPSSIAKLVGKPWCHVAVCRMPRRGSL